MNFFKFVKENNVFKWESDFMVLQFSMPSIQGFSSYLPLKDEKGIMYYYYTIEIFKKVEEWNDETNDSVTVLKLVSERSTHDFPCIIDLKHILDYQLNDDTKLNGQKIEYRDNTVKYTKSIFTEGFACDDFYEIVKSVDDKNKEERYVVYCGTTFDSQGDLNSSGIRTPYVDRKDIEELLECVKSFIQYSIDIHNKGIENIKDSFIIKNNKIYEYECLYKNEEDYENNIVTKSKFESIYCIGDVLDITIVRDGQEIDYDNVKIVQFEKDDIYLSNNQLINIKEIVYIYDEPISEKLSYNQEEIEKDFLDILSEDEKHEFKEKDIDYLLDSYKMIIINRTWMCREEHKFNINYQSDRVQSVIPIVKEVISNIKKTLLN